MEIERRRVLGLVAIWGVLGILPASRSQSTSHDSNSVAFRFEVPEAHWPTVASELRFQGTVERAEGKSVLTWIIAGAILLPYLAQAIIKLQRQIRHGGVVVDTRAGKVDVKVDKQLPGGLLIVVTPKGEVEVERNEVDPPGDALIGLLRKGLGGG